MQKPLTNKTIEKLKYDLVREGLVSFEDLAKAEDLTRRDEKNLAQSLIESTYISEQDLLNFIEAKLHIPYVNLDDYTLDVDCLGFISKAEAKNFRTLPLFKIEDVLTIAMADPLDLFLLNNLISSIDCKIEPVICSERSILDAIEKFYPEINRESLIPDNPGIEFDWKTELNNDITNDIQARRIIQSIIYQANIEKSREIILENTVDGLKVSFKIEKDIVNKGNIPVLLVPLCISSLKMLANIDVSTSEIPQIGRFKLPLVETDRYLYNYEINVSIATFPTINGERIVIKIYDKPVKVDELPINGIDLLKSCIQNPGIIIVCGSESSDRNYISYSLLSSLDADNKNIITIESVIKHILPGINQCELNEKVGFNLDKAIKFIEFQSSDIIYFEDIITEAGIELVNSLVMSGNLVIMELCANNPHQSMDKLLDDSYLAKIKDKVSCLIYIETKNTIKAFKP